MFYFIKHDIGGFADEIMHMKEEAFVGPMMDVWSGIALAMPNFLFALVILVVGLFASSVLSGLTLKLVKSMKIDGLMLQFSPVRKAQEAGWKIKPSFLLSKFVKWFFIVVTLIAVSDQLGLNQISAMLNDIVSYLPNVIVAIVILAIGFVLGRFVNDLAHQSMQTSQFGPQATLVVPLVAKYAIIIFAGLAAASQLNIAQNLIDTFFMAFMGALALALGLAFGLGGKEHASRLLDEMSKRK